MLGRAADGLLDEGEGASEGEDQAEESLEVLAEREANRVAAVNDWWAATAWSERKASTPHRPSEPIPPMPPPPEQPKLPVPRPMTPEQQTAGDAATEAAAGNGDPAAVPFRIMTLSAVQAHIERLRSVGMGTGRSMENR